MINTGADATGNRSVPGANPSRFTIFALIAVCMAAACVLMGARIDDAFDGYHGFNESFYSLVTRNYANRSLLEPSPDNKKIDLNIPPLYSYMLYFTGSVAGRTESVYRSVSIFFSLCAIILVALIGWRLYGINAGVIAAYLTAFCPLFVIPGRNVQVDSAYIALMLLGIFLYIESDLRKSRIMAVAAALSIGLSIFTKQFGGFALPILLSYELCGKNRLNGVVRKLLPVFMAAAIIPFMYYQYHMKHNPEGLIKSNSNVFRVIHSRMYSLESMMNTGKELFFGFSPLLSLLFMVSFIYVSWKFIKERKREDIFPIVGAAVVLCFYFVVTHHTYYVMGAIPFMALLGGRFLAGAMSPGRATVIAGICASAAIMSSLLIMGSVKYGYSRHRDACNHLKSIGAENTTVIISAAAQMDWPMIQWYCEDIQTVKERSFTEGVRSGAIDPGDGTKRWFMLDYATPRDINFQGPYVTVFKIRYFGVSALGRELCVIPAPGRTFIPGQILFKKSDSMTAGIKQMAEKPSVVLRELPPGYTFDVKGDNLYIIRNPM